MKTTKMTTTTRTATNKELSAALVEITESGVQTTGSRNNGFRKYHGVGNFYLINSNKLQIGIGIGKICRINSEELHIGNFWGDGSLKGDRDRYR